MNKLFEQNGVREDILPLKAFRPFIDISGAGQADTLPPQRLSHIISRAEKALDEDFPVLPASLYMQFRQNGNRSEYEAPYFRRRRMALELALAEGLEGKGRFVSRLADWVWWLLEESTWVIPAHNSTLPDMACPLTYAFREDVDNIDLFSAETGAALAWIYRFAGSALDGITPLITQRIRYELDRRILKPFMKYDHMWWMGLSGREVNNWNPWIISNVLTVCALCEEDTVIRSRLAERAMVMLDSFTSVYHDDGGCDEGPSYWGVAGASYFDCLELLYDMSGGRIDMFSQPLVKRMCEYIMNVYINGARFLNFADCPASVTPDSTLMARMGRRVGSPALLEFGASRISRYPQYPGGHCTYRTIKDLWDVYPDAGGVSLPEAAWMEGIQVLALRQSGDPARGLYLGIKGGHNAESHNHNDVGSFVVYKDGSPVFIDAGVGTYTAQTFSSRRYEIWTMQSSFHSLPDINGTAQSPGRQFAAKDVSFSPEDMRITMDIAGAYPPGAGVKKWIRTAALTERGITVSDACELGGEGKVSFNLLTLGKPDISVPGVISVAGAVAEYDGSLSAAVEEIPLDDARLKNGWNTDRLYRIRLSGKVPSKGEFVLTVK